MVESSPIRYLVLVAAIGLVGGCASSGAVDLDDLSEAQLAVEGNQRLAAGDVDRAIDCAEALYERTSDSSLKQEALFLSAEARFADESYVKAFRHYETLLTDFPYSKFVPRCEPHVYAIGVEYLSHEPWFFFGDLFTGRERGAEVMRSFAANFRSSDKADDALAALAGYRFSRGEFDEAIHYYAQLARDYPDSEWADLASYRRALSWKLSARGAGYDATPLLKAARDYRRYISERPHGEHKSAAEREAAGIDEEIAAGELKKAQFYAVREKADGARLHFANVALAYPGSKAAETARAALAEKGWDLSLNSVDTLTLPASTAADE